MPRTLIDWDKAAKLAYQGRYLLCSTARLGGNAKDWLRRLAGEAKTCGAKVTIEDGHVFLDDLHVCEMDGCDMVARHVADDGRRMCDVCWEIENDKL